MGIDTMKPSSVTLAEWVYKIAYFFTYQSKGMTVSVENHDLQKTEMIVAFKDVTYGVFQPTPFSVLDKVVKFANIKKGMKVFDFGCGDGIVARILASKGAYVDGVEEDNDIFDMIAMVPVYFSKAIDMLLVEYKAKEMEEDVLLQIKDSERRVHLSQGDAFTSNINFSTYDIVYLYYPEPIGKQKQALYNIKLNQLLSNPITGLNDKGILVILRQGVKESICFSNLEVMGNPLTIPSETAQALHIQDTDLRKRGVKNKMTAYKYRTAVASPAIRTLQKRK